MPSWPGWSWPPRCSVRGPSFTGALLARLTYVGTISYGVFLWHLPIMFAVRAALGLDLFDFGFWVTVALTLVASVIVVRRQLAPARGADPDLARRRTAGR